MKRSTEIINNTIDTLFIEVVKEYGLTHGDITPFESEELEKIKDRLGVLLDSFIEGNKNTPDSIIDNFINGNMEEARATLQGLTQIELLDLIERWVALGESRFSVTKNIRFLLSKGKKPITISIRVWENGGEVWKKVQNESLLFCDRCRESLLVAPDGKTRYCDTYIKEEIEEYHK